MFTHIPTGYKFNNRLEAKRVMGTSRYNKALKNREFTLHCTEDSTENLHINNIK